MDRICINGEEWVRLHDVCDILRDVGENPVFDNTDNILYLIAQMMFYDEVEAAGDDEEARAAAREFPGDFIVCKDLGYRNPNGKRVIYFMEFADGEGKAIDNSDRAMIFEYKSKADEVAKTLGEGWKSICIGHECRRITKRTMDAFKRITADMDDDK